MPATCLSIFDIFCNKLGMSDFKNFSQKFLALEVLKSEKMMSHDNTFLHKKRHKMGKKYILCTIFFHCSIHREIIFRLISENSPNLHFQSPHICKKL